MDILHAVFKADYKSASQNVTKISKIFESQLFPKNSLVINVIV